MTYGWAPQPRGDFGRLRAGHADRERAIDVLKAAFAEGRLNQDEYTDRVGIVHASRTYAELTAVTVDLPVGPLGLMTPASPLVPMAPRLPQPPPPGLPASPDDYGDSPARGIGLGLAILFCGIAMLCGILALLAMLSVR
jgi:hypothetical protein